jgi:hypothetical protein
MAFEFDVENRPDDLYNFADVLTVCGSVRRRHTVVELLYLPVKANKLVGLKAA